MMAPALLLRIMLQLHLNRLQLQRQLRLRPNHHRNKSVLLRNTVPSTPSRLHSNILCPPLRSRTVLLPPSIILNRSSLRLLGPPRATINPPSRRPSLRLLPTVAAYLMQLLVDPSLPPCNNFPIPTTCAHPAPARCPFNLPMRGLLSRP